MPPPILPDEDKRLVIQAVQDGGYAVSEFMGAKLLFVSGDIDDALGYIKDKLEAKDAKPSV